jgi:hypothetical protein
VGLVRPSTDGFSLPASSPRSLRAILNDAGRPAMGWAQSSTSNQLEAFWCQPKSIGCLERNCGLARTA